MTPRSTRSAFTLLEMLVAMSVTVIIIILLLQVINTSSTQWQNTTGNAQAFQAARAAFETVTRTLSQATLKVEYDYYDANHQSRIVLAANAAGDAEWESIMNGFEPVTYGRSSSLHFISGKALVNHQHTHSLFFQAPLDYDQGGDTVGPQGQLNAVGFFVRYEDDSAEIPSHLEQAPRRSRYRLMQFLQPTSALDTYRSATANDWFRTSINASPSNEAHLLAENIVALIILPKFSDDGVNSPDAIAPGYEYDSRTPWSGGAQPPQMHQLPPVVRVIMVAIDEASASRHPTIGQAFAGLFQDVSKLTTEPDGDLATVRQTLERHSINYRIFEADVAIRAAQWSQ